MNIVIKNPIKNECFSGIFQHIKLFSEHINIMFEAERMYVQALINFRVSVFELYIPSSWFDVYEHTSVSNLCLGVNSNILFRILNTYEKGQNMNIMFDNDDVEKLCIHFTSDGDKNVFDKHFEIPLMDIDSEIMHIPAFESQADILIPSGKFASIINQLKLFGDSLEIDCSEEKILLSSCSQESGKMFVEIQMDDLNSYSINEGQELKLSFSLSHLHNICAYNKLAKEIEIKFTDKFPMKITYDLLDGAKIVFYLAPKISDD